MAAAVDLDQMQKIVNHVFLPPKLPHSADKDSEVALINITLEALKSLRALLPEASSPQALENAISLLKNTKATSSLPGGEVTEVGLKKILKSLAVGRTMAVNVSAQNAAILVTRMQDELIFEEFELSPNDEAVLGTKGRLIRSFPAQAVTIRASLLDEADFATMVARTLSTMSQQQVAEMVPTSAKSGTTHAETRDTVRPAMVSELFFGVLRGIGNPADVTAIAKKTRDQVLWKDALLPWRRSPMWLLLRVALQLVILRSTDGSYTLYKEVMVFIMSQVLRAANGLPSDTIFSMKAKIHRRLQKLARGAAPTLPSLVIADINHTLQQASDFLSQQWASHQLRDVRDLQLDRLALLDFDRDSYVDIPALDKYIKAITSRTSTASTSSFVPTSQLKKYKPSELPILPTTITEDSYYAAANISAFELWVANHLDRWFIVAQGDACSKLHRLMVQYHSLVQSQSSGNPEATSTMLLTIFELWVACDELATRECPLLSEYDPGIPSCQLQNLLLPSLSQMKRLAKVEEYLEKRGIQATKTQDRLFSTKGSDSFACRYSGNSPEHRTLLLQIEQDATTARQQKRLELQRLQAEYRRLDQLYDRTDHEYRDEVARDEDGVSRTVQIHVGYCAKEALAAKRDALSIKVHEWPIPKDPHEAKAVVFELRVPEWFGHWREAQIYLLSDVLLGERPRAATPVTYLLSSNDPHLTSKYFARSAGGRVDLLSVIKPVFNTHYSNKAVLTLSDSDICVDNGLKYRLYDTRTSSYLGLTTFNDQVPRACTYTLPCQALQQFIFRPASAPDGPAPNCVIAGQDSCPESMTLEEYRELATLPLGRHIQWANIRLQLAMPGVDFKKLDSTLVVLQCIYQAGPPSSNVLRESHDMFKDHEKASSLIKDLSTALTRVKGNWESAQALYAFIAIGARALSLSGSVAVQSSCLAFLASARIVAMSWVHQLREKAFAATEIADKTAFVAKSVELALICSSTFDVDGDHAAHVLATTHDASTLLQMSVVIQEGEHSMPVEQAQRVAPLALRHKKLLHRLYPLLAEQRDGLDDAVHHAWSAYAAGTSGWIPVSESADHWLSTTSAATNGLSTTVHLNLLSGELLVNGLPLDQPPKDYRAHPMYHTLFGQAAVEVMPSTIPGFKFSTKRSFGGCAIHLGMNSSCTPADLIVRATKNGRTYETIPPRFFESSYPCHFADDYVHWYDLASKAVEFRPVHTQWDAPSSELHTLSKRPGETLWRLSKAECTVMGLKSRTSSSVYHVLNPLVEGKRIHNILQPCGKELHVDVSTLRLGFTLHEGAGNMESKEYRSMIVDSDETIKTLIGLQSKLVLKSLKRGDRMILIPESTTIHHEHVDGHAVVTVPRSSVTKVHSVNVDPLLGRILDNGDLGVKLYLAYLHALTSFCLVDPLTLKTGTEQALTILASAALRSFAQLSQQHVDRLEHLANLTPGRRFYPPYKRVMQTVDWSQRLSFLSQHGYFVDAVKALLRQSEQAAMFYPDTKLLLPCLEKTDVYLLQRDNVSSATVRVSGYGAEDFTTQHDHVYNARDRDVHSYRAMRASGMSRLFSIEDAGVATPVMNARRLWQELCNVDQVYGLSGQNDVRKVKYDAVLLRDGFVNVMQHLLGWHKWLSKPSESSKQKFAIVMWLSTIASTLSADEGILQVVAMFLKSDTLAQINIPESSAFHPKQGIVFDRSALRAALSPSRRSLWACPEINMTKNRNEKNKHFENRRDNAWQSASDSAIETFMSHISPQWPSNNPIAPANQNLSTYVDITAAMETVRKQFKIWQDNGRLDGYVRTLEQTISSIPNVDVVVRTATVNLPSAVSSHSGHVANHELFELPVPSLPVTCHKLELRTQRRSSRHGTPPLLGSLISTLAAASGRSQYEQRYLTELTESLEALTLRNEDRSPVIEIPLDDFSVHLDRCGEHVRTIYDLLTAAVSPVASSITAQAMHLWPRISPEMFLQQLGRHGDLPEAWKLCIVDYGLALTALQRARRLVVLAEASSQEDLANELRNTGHQNWDPMDSSDSLLMEIESGVMIREVQEQIAAQMRDPQNGNNAVMQLNMGEGKSSIIVPIVAAALANGKQLVKVFVAKPQSKQMAQMLVSKLGGLLNRRVYYMPVSRSLRLDQTAAAALSTMLRACMSEGGILLVQPEHVLSLQLMAPECYVSGKEDVGWEIMLTLDFLNSSSRDIIDESDENFSVRFELIYTMGMQRPIESSPDRWFLFQQIFQLIRLLIPEVATALPLSVEYRPGITGSFPRVRLLRPDAAVHLLQLLAKSICDNGLDRFPISRQSEASRKAVHAYITKGELNTGEINAVEDSLFWTKTTSPLLLLLRGLIAGGVLEFVLGQKRWRVNYGLTTRTRVAVPYRAKDSPSPRSEFSHPDVVILLTSLSYYYGGLSDEHMFITLGHLMMSDQRDIEYQAWVRDSHSLPDAFLQLQGINIKDRQQCTVEIFPAFRHAKSVVDYYLSHLVFPKEMKEFPDKLSASGWDLGKRKGLPVTGFSGTNDSKCLLPIPVDHLDLPDQKHTNALVMEHILQPENELVLMDPSTQATSDAEHLLATVARQDRPIQVILDVGAQILELDNLEVAKAWLRMHDSPKQAAVFVNDNDDVCVVDRHGRVDLLRTSSFSARLESCLIFLDEAHTRGIDLKLPVHYRAAVTLGTNLTKDRLVQACMRMRKLGKGQSVVFCLSQEMQVKIAERTSKSASELAVSDILLFSMSETHTDARRSIPLWAVQGERFIRQDKLWRDACVDNQTSLTKSHAEKFLEQEAQTINDRYRPRLTPSQPAYSTNASDSSLQHIVERCQLFSDLHFTSSTLQEEQERELSPEIEQERQVQKAPAADPAEHKLHKDVQAFANRGSFSANSEAYMPAFSALQGSTAAKDFSTNQLSTKQNLYVTADFAKTIQTLGGSSYVSDAFQRPVQWLLTTRDKSCNAVERVLIISPFEANQLNKIMTSSTTATMHVYKPRTHSGYPSLSKLDFHTISAQSLPINIPRGIAIQLDLFAGQLYITSYDDYREICHFLGLSADTVTEAMGRCGWMVSADGFILSDDQGRVGGTSGIKKSPVNFFKILMSKIRRNGKGIGKTHMGQLLKGKLFQASEFGDE
ncbi:hypothetical protein LTR86_000831 [Recurvomyces mirabilis]|nr:hypothetical protein LTR86_000831 [Recurvomyces mirabilis]